MRVSPFAYVSSCSCAAPHCAPAPACGRKPPRAFRSATNPHHARVSKAFAAHPSGMTSKKAFKLPCICRSTFVPPAAQPLMSQRHLRQSNFRKPSPTMSQTHSEPFYSELSAQSSSDDHLLYEEQIQFPVHWKTTLRLVTPYIRPANTYYTLLSILSMCTLLLSTVLKLLIPYIIKLILDSITDTKTLSVPLFCILFSANCVVNILQFVRTITYSTIECDASRRFGIDVYQHLHMLCASFHSNRRVGQLCKIIDKGTDALDTIVDLVLFTILPTYVSVQVSRACRLLQPF